MIRELSCDLIYNEFLKKEHLTDIEKEVLDYLLKGYSIVKIAQISSMSERVVSRQIRKIKDKYKDYKEIELSKLNIFGKK